jgi:flotillin
VIREKQQAYPNYAEERMVSIITEKLPAIAEAVAAPLKNAGKMTFVSSDGSAGSRLTNDISQIMGQLPDTVEALTGVNLKRVMKRLEGPVGAAVKTAVESTD